MKNRVRLLNKKAATLNLSNIAKQKAQMRKKTSDKSGMNTATSIGVEKSQEKGDKEDRVNTDAVQEEEKDIEMKKVEQKEVSAIEKK